MRATQRREWLADFFDADVYRGSGMGANLFLITITFVMIIVIIMLSDNITTAVLIIGLLANFLVISGQLHKMGTTLSVCPIGSGGIDIASNAPPAKDQSEPAQITKEPDQAPPRSNIYGDTAYEEWNRTKQEYQDSACIKPRTFESPAENTEGADAANALMAQRRFRDKKAMDGATIKGADYYRYHFGNELDEAENRDWRTAYEM